MRTAIINGIIFDTDRLAFGQEGGILIEDGVIREIGPGAGKGAATHVIDAKGMYLMPGFIDAHVHFRLASMDFRKLAGWSEVEFGIAMAELARDTLGRGFTSVRDLGGDVEGLIKAIRAGMTAGPRILRAGRMLTQTGGHGDSDAGPRAVPDCGCQMLHTSFSIISDGADAVRKAARHNLRDGSDFLKIHVSGGVASPSDPLDSVQYTAAEVLAAVEEARNRKTYVAAHAYTPEAIAMAVRCGVTTIEHGNLIDGETAQLMADQGAVLVPTLATYEAMDLLGAQLGMPKVSLEKNKLVFDRGLGAVELAKNAGVARGFGTDLLGEAQKRQNREFELRAEVETAAEILHSVYVTNAKLLKAEGKIGRLSEGAAGDVVVVRPDPLKDIRVLADPLSSLAHVVKAGQPIA